MTLREMRIEAGLRQTDILAGYPGSGIDIPLYSKIESGRVLPQESFLRHIYAMCGQTPPEVEISRIQVLASGCIPVECRRESYTSVDSAGRRREILRALEDGPATARELAYKLGYRERNATSPRLTELCKAGLVEHEGKRLCGVTGKLVTVWAKRRPPA